MADDVTPSEVRARGFDVVRRGYDRVEVDRYLSILADEIERLGAKLEDRSAKELKVGLDDPEALALELGAIGGEVAAILEAARTAADGMRSRAASDVDQWRTTVEQETRTIISETTEQSQSMRAAAWNEGSSMLSSSRAEARSLVDAAKEDVLFIRAEAEREAIRLTGDAKRDREESIRTARMEAEQLIGSARSESDGILAAANTQAEQAQERARALEDRRTELLSELESARASIGHLEEEIESRRLELETPVAVVEPEPDPLSHHGSDSSSVRIVAPSKSVKLMPVDADELVADVVALRSGKRVKTGSEPDLDTTPAPIETVAVIAPPPQEEEEPPVRKEPSVEPEPDDDDIGSLFASLRDGAAEPEAAETPPLQQELESIQPGGVSEPAGPEELEIEEEPPKEKLSTVDRRPSAEEAESRTSEAGESVADDAPVLIPFQNAALKDIKRTLVELQNDALEHLRTDVGWVPKRAFTNKFKAPFGNLAEQITGAKNDGGAAKEFGADLFDAVTGALAKARQSGAGDRQVASSVSRVFRMWRADEAERRVVDAAQELSP
ncbi:MAG: DivIVA domain-containing protein [Acidimicrobiia bacterium]